MNASKQAPRVFLARHGETAWTITGQHTGLTDLPLTAGGEHNARQLGDRLRGSAFAKVFTSPLRRASDTCELAGFGTTASIDVDLIEWNYGEYEGRTTEEIEAQQPGWDLFRDGCPGGETVDQVAIRANRAIERIRAIDADVLVFSHSHFLHVFAACWLNLAPSAGRHFLLSTAALSIVGYHHGPVVRLWNDCRHTRDDDLDC